MLGLAVAVEGAPVVEAPAAVLADVRALVRVGRLVVLFPVSVGTQQWCNPTNIGIVRGRLL